MSDVSHTPRAPHVKPPAISKAGVRATLFVALLVLVVCLLGFGGYGRLLVYFFQPVRGLVLSGKTQTQCVGRYLIDTPVEMGNFSMASTEFQYGLDSYSPSIQMIFLSPDAPASFEEVVAKSVQALKKGRNEELNTSMLLAHEVWDTPHGKAHMLRHLSGLNSSPYWPITSELHIQVAGHHLLIMGTSYESAFADPPPVHAGFRHINPKPMEDRLKVIAQHIKSYTDARTAPAGFCMDGVLMDDKAMGYDVESSLFVLTPPQGELSLHALGIWMLGHLQTNEPAFTERISAQNSGLRMEELMWSNNQQLVELRKGPRSVDAMPGLEYAEGRHWWHAVWFQTEWQSQWSLAQQRLQRPAIDMFLRLGTWDRASPLDKEQALALWDRLLGSLRLSPANGG